MLRNHLGGTMRPLIAALTFAFAVSQPFSQAFAEDAAPKAAPDTAADTAANAGPDANKVVATVNGEDITELDLALAAQDYAQQLSRVPPQLQRNLLVGVVVDMHVLADAALKADRQDDDLVKKRLEYMRLRTLRDSYFTGDKDLTPGDEELKARYEKEYGDFKGSEERHASHILLKSKEDAEAVIKQLDAGKDFAELAKEKSTGPSGPKGGDLGYFTRDRMVKPFADVAFAMEPGSYTKEPVKTQFGWHVIKLEDVRNQPAPTFEAVKDTLRTDIIRERYNEAMEGLKAKADIEVVEEAPAADDGATDASPADTPAGNAPAADAPAGDGADKSTTQ